MLKELFPLTKEECRFIYNELSKEGEHPSPERLKRIEEAVKNARKMKKKY